MLDVSVAVGFFFIPNYVRCYIVDVSVVNNSSLNSLIKSFDIIHFLLPKLTSVIKNMMVIYSGWMTVLFKYLFK